MFFKVREKCRSILLLIFSMFRSVRERQDMILRRLALQPPPDSPYVHKLNLDGVKRLLKSKEQGLWPPPQPKPAAVVPLPSTVASATQAQNSVSLAQKPSYTAAAPPVTVVNSCSILFLCILSHCHPIHQNAFLFGASLVHLERKRDISSCTAIQKALQHLDYCTDGWVCKNKNNFE